MNEIETLLAAHSALALRLTQETELRTSLEQLVCVFAQQQSRSVQEQAEEGGSPSAAEMQLREAVESSTPDGEMAVQALLQQLLSLDKQSAGIDLVRRRLTEHESGQERSRQGVLLSAQTPQRTPGALTGGYEQTLTVAGPAAGPTRQSMAEISRFFERDARRYG